MFKLSYKTSRKTLKDNSVHPTLEYFTNNELKTIRISNKDKKQLQKILSKYGIFEVSVLLHLN